MKLIERAIRQIDQAKTIRVRHGFSPRASSMRDLDQARANLVKRLK